MCVCFLFVSVCVCLSRGLCLHVVSPGDFGKIVCIWLLAYRHVNSAFLCLFLKCGSFCVVPVHLNLCDF